MKTVFITGASSGIGRETALLFQKNGWNVAASMRSPERERELAQLRNVIVLPCDVTDVKSIQSAIAATNERFGKIDVLINNAGYYTVGPLEAATSEQIKRQLDTNLLGVIETTKAVLPYFRKQHAGMVINLSSVAGIISIPLQSLYHATKFGIEGFSESLQYELEPFGIRIRLIEPGTIKTEFCGRSMTVTDAASVPEYKEYSNTVVNNLVRNGNNGSDPAGVAKTIYKAAISKRKKMRFKTGKMKNMITLRKLLPLGMYRYMVKNVMES